MRPRCDRADPRLDSLIRDREALDIDGDSVSEIRRSAREIARYAQEHCIDIDEAREIIEGAESQ